MQSQRNQGRTSHYADAGIEASKSDVAISLAVAVVLIGLVVYCACNVTRRDTPSTLLREADRGAAVGSQLPAVPHFLTGGKR